MKNKQTALLVLAFLMLFVLTACSGPEATYKKAQNLLSKGNYTEAAEKFAGLGSYEDAAALTIYCKACALCEEGNFEQGITAFETLGDYKDCQMRISYYTARSWDAISIGTTEFEWMQKAKSIYSENPLYLDSTERVTELDTRIGTAMKTLYDDAITMAEAGQYSTAIATFERLGNYNDSESCITYYNIRAEEDALSESIDQDAVIAVATRYSDMGAFFDCYDRSAALVLKADEIVATRYDDVDALIAARKCNEAEQILSSFGNYGNEKIPEKYYAIGEQYLVDGKWNEAINAFEKSNGDDAAERASVAYYENATALMQAGKNAEALLAYRKAGDYLDAKTCAAALAEQFNSRIVANSSVHTVALKNDGTVLTAGGRSHRNSQGKKKKYDAGIQNVNQWRDIIALSTDFEKTLGLKKDGTVVCACPSGNLEGNVGFMRDIVALEAGMVDSYGVRKDGTVAVTGAKKDLCQEVEKWTNIKKIIERSDVGDGHFYVLGLRRDNTVVVAGNPNFNPDEIQKWTNIVDIYVASTHAVGLKADGTVVAVGENGCGQCNTEEWTDIVEVVAAYQITVGRRSNGTVVATGDVNGMKLSLLEGVVEIEYYHTGIIGLTNQGKVIVVPKPGYKQYYGPTETWDDIISIYMGDGGALFGLKVDGTVLSCGTDDDENGRLDVSDWNLFAE